MLKEILIWLYVTLKPEFWLSGGTYSKKWDKELRSHLRNPKFTDFDKHTVRLNSITVWIANYPYQYAFIYAYGDAVDYVPSRRTRVWFRMAYTKAYRNVL